MRGPDEQLGDSAGSLGREETHTFTIDQTSLCQILPKNLA